MVVIIQTTIITVFTSLTVLTLAAQAKSILEVKWRIDAETYKQSLLVEQERYANCKH